MFRKLRNSRGETLAEVLVSLVIAALSALLLASLFLASGRISMDTRERDRAFFQTVEDAELQRDPIGQGHVILEGEGLREEISVDIFGGEGVQTWAAAGTGGTP